MRIHLVIALFVGCLLCGCASPQIRFTQSQCVPVVGEEQTEAVRFVSNFQTNEAVPEQQLIYLVSIVDSSGRQIPSATGKYTDKNGNLTAAKGLMVLQSPWSFENINVSIPAPELSAARENGAAYALFQLTTPDGQILAQDRAPLPPEFASARAAAPTVAMSTQRAEVPAEAAEAAPPQAPRGSRTKPTGRETEQEAVRPDDARRARSSEPEVAKAQNPPSNRRSNPRSRPEPMIRESAPPEDESVVAPRSARPESQARRRTDEEVVPSERADLPVEEPAPRAARTTANSRRTAPPLPAREPETAAASTPRAKNSEPPVNNRARRTPPAGSSARVEKPAPAQPAPKPVEAEPGVQDVVATPPPDRSAGSNYEVRASDSLRSIALEQYGDAQYWPMILRANPEVNPLKLKVGDKLYLPPLDDIQSGVSPTTPRKTVAERSTQAPAPATSVYLTKEGDTLPYIAKQLYGDSRRWREIYDLNRDQLETPSSIRRGMRLKLPEAPAKAAEGDRR